MPRSASAAEHPAMREKPNADRGPPRSDTNTKGGDSLADAGEFAHFPSGQRAEGGGDILDRRTCKAAVFEIKLRNSELAHAGGLRITCVLYFSFDARS
jgi:hypothetical protein